MLTNSYQWYKNDTIIENALNRDYKISFSIKDTGVYHCVIKNSELEDLSLSRDSIRVIYIETGFALSDSALEKEKPINSIVAIITSNIKNDHNYELLKGDDVFYIDEDSLKLKLQIIYLVFIMISQ